MSQNRPRLTVIGPLPPLRGGISKHTLSLFRALVLYESLCVWSPTKLYPSFLYPGQSQFDSLSSEVHDEHLDYISKVGILLRILKRETSDVFLIVWWTPVMAIWTILWATILKIKRVKVVFLCHNVEPHENSYMARLLTRLSLRLGDGHIVQSESEKRHLQKLGFKSKVKVLVHPVANKAFSIAESDLGDGRGLTYLSIGIMRDYKNIPLLIEAFTRLKDSNHRLRIVGEIWSKGLEEILTNACSRDKRISFRAEYVSDEVFQDEIAKADCIVLPYSKVTGSGVLSEVLAQNKKVILSDIEGFAELAPLTNQISTFKSESAEDLARAMAEARKSRSVQTESPEQQLMSWQAYAVDLKSFLTKVG